MREDELVMRAIVFFSLASLAVLFAACGGGNLGRCTQSNLRACHARCEAGHGDACAIAAYIKADDEEAGEKSADDQPKAAEYFLKSCLHRHAVGCYGAGLTFILRPTPNLEMAARSFEAGCALGHLDSCAMRSASHEMAHNENPEAAFAEYDRTCAAGSAVGCSLAGDRLVAGRNMARDEALGARFLARACDLGESSACERLKARTQKLSPIATDGGAEAAAGDASVPSE
ncbi:MAG: sel1 repeat family protein [Labilithrix sp.]|nr:sel1 repeat family protein [Labilithrix sp.]